MTTDSEHWSDYWSRGCLTSLPQDFVANYDGEVRAFWEKRFRSVPNGGKVIDLCTGNGAVALLAAGYAEQQKRQYDVTAVDAAAIRPDVIAERFPAQAALLGSIHFISNVRVEDLDIAQQFDLVTSQYGLEYTDHSAAAPRVARLLKPGALLVMVTHAADSDILAYMRREEAEYDRLRRTGLLKALQGYLENDIDHDKLTRRLGKIQSQLAPDFRQSGSPLLRSVLETLGGIIAMPPDRLAASRQHLQAYYDQTLHGMNRLRDMLRVNETLAADPEWTGVFERAGLSPVETGDLTYRGQHHAGAFHVFRKPPEQER
jgi:ubiquinone/menaquinone biosynthesis C-methylase UbiE